MNRSVFNRVAGLAAVLAIYGTSASARASILYQDNTSIAAYNTYSSVANGNGLLGFGDDYNTGITGNVSLTGLTFTGGTFSSGDSVAIDFYTSTGAFVTSLTPSNSEVNGYSSTHTLAAGDFGSGVTIPGSGYFIFAPYNVAGTTAHFALDYGNTAPIVGTSLTTNVKSDDNGALTVGNNVFGFGAVPYAAVELDGTAVPEPASLGLVGSGALLLLRRRRTA